MSMLTNSIRPNSDPANTHRLPGAAAYGANKPVGVCMRCNVRSVNVTVSKHPVLKMLCKDCKQLLAQRNAAKNT